MSAQFVIFDGEDQGKDLHHSPHAADITTHCEFVALYPSISVGSFFELFWLSRYDVLPYRMHGQKRPVRHVPTSLPQLHIE